MCNYEILMNNEQMHNRCRSENTNKVESNNNQNELNHNKNNNNSLITKLGWITNNKPKDMFRILSMNLHSFGSDNFEKVMQLKRQCNKIKIDCYLFSSYNRH